MGIFLIVGLFDTVFEHVLRFRVLYQVAGLTLVSRSC